LTISKQRYVHFDYYNFWYLPSLTQRRRK